MDHLMALVLAAGEGKRMKSKNSKVIHKVCGKPMIQWVCDSVRNAGAEECILVIGHGADQVKECMGDKVKYVMQERQLGTGHAVMQAEEYLKGRKGCLLVLCGDTPLVTADTISAAVKYHREKGNSATVLSARLENPYGYGRIVRSESGDVVKIVEERDATAEEKSINEINSGMYCFDMEHLVNALGKLGNNNDQGEYYLTDTIEILIKDGLKVGAVVIDDADEILGVNDRLQLAQANALARKRILESHMKAGVTIINPESTYIDEEVRIGMDTVIYPGTILEGKTVIGEDCIIGPCSRIVSSTIGNGVEVNNSVILESSVGNKTRIGPFAYLRPGSHVGEKVKIGDFVEIKNSSIGDKTSISHLTYVGDSDVGRNVNFGCGVVTVNYDGRTKNRTRIEDNAFIGCNTNLVAPVRVKADSYIAAGSTITAEVPEYSLAIARARQVIKEDWVLKKDMKRKEKE